MPTWVLWLFFLTTWSWSGVPMTPGFVGWVLYETRAECLQAAKTLIQPTVCMTADMPDPFPIAMTDSEYEEAMREQMKLEKAF